MPFKKGQSGNPKGTKVIPKEFRWNTFFEKALERPLPADVATLLGYENELAYREGIVAKYMRDLVSNGDLEDLRKFIESRIDRQDGKAKQSTELSGEIKVVQPILGAQSKEA